MVGLRAMRRSARILLAIVLVAAVFSGPMAMALDGCLAMCDAPCALTCGTVDATPTLTPPVAISEAATVSTVPPLALPPTVLKPPPKLAALAL